MRKALVLCIILFLCPACIDGNWAFAPKRTQDQTLEPRIHYLPIEQKPAITEWDTVFYFCGVEYPKGYDWKRDTALGNSHGEVYLLENGWKKFAFPIGYDNEVSQDPDTHHLIDSTLYTEFAGRDETVLKKNGTTLFRYPGKEKIDWILPKGEDIYTLGKSIGGEGFSFRKNGDVLLQRATGTVLHGLHSDKGHIYFIYSRYTAGNKAYFVVEDGLDSQIQLPNDLQGEIKDIMVVRSELHFLTTLQRGFFVNGSLWPNVVSHQVIYIMDSPRMVFSEQGLFVYGLAENPSADIKALTAFSSSGLNWVFGSDRGNILFDEGDFAAACDRGGGTIYMYQPGKTRQDLSGFTLMGERCACYRSGILAAGLSSCDYNTLPEIWIDGKRTKLKYNGYLSGVSIIPPRINSSNHQD